MTGCRGWWPRERAPAPSHRSVSQYPIGHGAKRKAAYRTGWHLPVLVRNRVVRRCRTIGATRNRIGADGARVHGRPHIGSALQPRRVFWTFPAPQDRRHRPRRVLDRSWSSLWLYIVGPLVGAAIGSGIHYVQMAGLEAASAPSEGYPSPGTPPPVSE